MTLTVWDTEAPFLAYGRPCCLWLRTNPRARHRSRLERLIISRVPATEPSFPAAATSHVDFLTSSVISATLKVPRGTEPTIVMKLIAPISALVFASGTIAKHHGVRDHDCDSTSVLSDYSTLQRREVGARNTVVRDVFLIEAWSASF